MHTDGGCCDDCEFEHETRANLFQFIFGNHLSHLTFSKFIILSPEKEYTFPKIIRDSVIQNMQFSKSILNSVHHKFYQMMLSAILSK